MSAAWLITGARGFVGKAVCRFLAQQAIPVIPLDRDRPQSHGVAADLSASVPDLGEKTPEVVVHLAGLAHRPATDGAFERANVGGTRNLLAALEASPHPPRTLILASSVAVYGRTKGTLLSEETEPKPDTPYADSKHQAELVLSAWAKERGVEAVILRLPLVVGVDPPGNLGKMVSAIAAGRYHGIGKGGARRSMVLADDIAASLPRLATASGTFHLTDRRHPSFRDLEEAICRRLGRPAPRRIPTTIAHVLGRIGDLGHRLGSAPPIDTETVRKMTSSLTFDDSKAVDRIDWAPASVVESTDRWIG